MTYAAGQLILRDEYNVFATGSAAGVADHAVANINTIWGTGTGDKGYGQGTTLSSVAVGNSVTATQWSTLIARLNSILLHQSNSGYTLSNGPTPIVTGGVITAVSNLSSSIGTAFTNRINAASNGTDSITTTVNGTNSNWITSVIHTITLTFGSYDQARYYFNAGGQCRFSSSKAQGVGTSANKETSWQALVTAIGTISLGAHSTAKTSGSGTTDTLTTTKGFYEISAAYPTPTIIFKQFAATASYTTNYIQISVAPNSVTPNILTFTVTYADAHNTNTDETVNGLITTSATLRPPETTYLSNSWGTPTMPAGTSSQS